MRNSVPATMKAVFQNEANGQLFINEVPVPQPQKGEVLIKMEASPINPSDLSFLQGTYEGTPNYPVIPGIEGSGTVVTSGGGVLANMRVGKRVTCTSSTGNSGTWAEYMVTSVMRCVPFSKAISFEQGAMMIVNPMTVMAFIDIIKTGKHKAVVNNAAASALGKMMIAMCQKFEIPLINIVRRKEQQTELFALGAKHVLISTDAGFELELKNLANELNATLFLDAVGGEQTNIMAKAAPAGSKIMPYAQLSEQASSINSRLIIQNDLAIEGFSMGHYSAKQGIIKTLKSFSTIKKLIANELKSEVQAWYKLDQLNEAVEFYKNNMSKGKVIINCKQTIF